jgi:hypothetical protein
MIYIKSWKKHDGRVTTYYYEGIFLFWIIPLYIKRIEKKW